MVKKHSTENTPKNLLDNGRAFHPSISTKRDYRSVILSYRIYKRLPEKEKLIFNSCMMNYTPIVGCLALWFRSKCKYLTMNNIIFIKVQREYLEEFEKAALKFVGYLPKDKYLKRQLLFMGYQPISWIKMRSSYLYFMTNRMLEGEYLVFPKRFSDNYKTLKKGKYPYFQSYMGLMGIPGITKTRFSNERN